MRTRVFKDSTSYGGYLDWWWRLGGYSSSVTESYISSYWYERMRDVVTPNFHDRVRRGDIIINPKTKISEKVTEVCYAIEAWSGNAWDDACCSVCHTGNTFTETRPTIIALGTDDEQYTDLEEIILDIYSSNIGKAVNQSWSNVDVSEAAALASLGELPETLRWLVSLLTRAIKIIRFFKSKESRLKALKAVSPTATVDSLSDLWLEFRYAIRPLVFEAKQCMEALQASIQKGSRKTARGWDRIQSSSTTTINHVLKEAWIVPVDWTESLYVNFRAGVLYDIESDINGIMALWGLDQSMEAIWELTPFSFIVDWFFTIGDVISAWSISPHLRPLGSWITVDSIAQVKGEMSGSLQDNSHWINGQSMDLVQEGSYAEEARYSVRFVDPDRKILPSINVNLDMAKILDLATIGRSLFRSLRA